MIVLRLLASLYWLIAYLAFLVSFAYLIGFVGNRYTFSTIDSGLQIPEREALAKDLWLMALFGVQHSLMARRWWKGLIREPWQRSTYLLATAFVLGWLYTRWEPIPALVWRVEHGWLLNALFWSGWGLVLWAAVSCDHLATFGLRQLIAYWKGVPYQHAPFQTPGPYRWLRHPMMLGLIIAFWATPEMSKGHLLFASVMTAYILIGVRLEERDLIRIHGQEYENYRSRRRL
jgi:protein-S-isoprenylcysteine O-methyltransferase Ste14